MADAAFLLLVVIGLARMTGEAERSSRLQDSHRGGGVAFVAGAMRVDRRSVRLDDAFGAVARGAVQPRGVVVVVARGTGRHRRLRLEGHGGDVTRDAGHVRMPGMRELDPTVAG